MTVACLLCRHCCTLAVCSVQLTSDPAHCGSCSNHCEPNQVCLDGTCRTEIPDIDLPISAAASWTLGPYSTCETAPVETGQLQTALTWTTTCTAHGANSSALAITITQANFESLAVYRYSGPGSAMCLRVSTCGQVELAASKGLQPGTTRHSALSWSPPSGLPAPPAAPSSTTPTWPACGQQGCADGLRHSTLLLPNTGRDETVYLHTRFADRCIKGLFVLLSVAPDCILSSP